MSLRIYNTLTRRKEPFETLESGVVRMYVCGPTVYDQAHIGHAMSVLVFDILRRYLEHVDYQVQHVINYTDVDDKIIQRAQEEGVDPLALAERYIQEFNRHLVALNVLPATLTPRATEEMDTIIQMVSGLIDVGLAYQVNGDVYFRVSRHEGYGRLSGRRLDEMAAGARVEVDTRKEHPMDFALWKASKPGEPAWDSPWGKGRPGWHIECSAMNLRHLGEQIDIHGGGTDLIFPHHENEIVQTESLTGKPFARYWVHNGMLQLAGEKMSKSLGNLITIEAFLADHEADVLRMMVLNSSYRSPLTYRPEAVDQAARALDRLRSALRPATPGADGAPPDVVAMLESLAATTRANFHAAMDDDFNTAQALGQIFDLVRAINQARDAGASRQELQVGQDLLRELSGVLGLHLEPRERSPEESTPYIELLVQVRNHLRREKQWALADLVRDRLADLGVVLEDDAEGTTWRLK